MLTMWFWALTFALPYLHLKQGPINKQYRFGQMYLHNCGHLFSNEANVHPENINSQNHKMKNNKNINHTQFAYLNNFFVK